jgi:hypothetical protein
MLYGTVGYIAVASTLLLCYLYRLKLSRSLRSPHSCATDTAAKHTHKIHAVLHTHTILRSAMSMCTPYTSLLLLALPHTKYRHCNRRSTAVLLVLRSLL